MCLHTCMCPFVWVHKYVCAWRSQRTGLGTDLQALSPFFLFLRKISHWPRWDLPGRLDWLAVNPNHHLRSHQVWDCKSRATLPGFSTWLLVIKVRYTTEPFPQYLSFFFCLQISNPFVYLKLTWWYRKSPDSLSPQWAWKFLYLTPCFIVCWNRWNSTKALLLPRPCSLYWNDPLYSMTSSQDMSSML